MKEWKEPGSVMLISNGKNVVTPKTLVPIVDSGVKDTGLVCEVRMEIDFGAVEAEVDRT